MPRHLRFYTPGKAATSEGTVRSVFELLAARGWECTLDWTTVPVEKPYREHLEVNRPAAEAMKAAAASSDLVVLVPDAEVFGALIEIGAALGAGAEVAVLGAGRQSVFWCLDQVHLLDDLDGLRNLAAEMEARHAGPRYDLCAGARWSAQ